MRKKVYFYRIDLKERNNGMVINYEEVKKIFIDIIEENSEKKGRFNVLDITNNNELHYIADIVEYKQEKLFLRLSCQKYSSGFIQRNYKENEPLSILEGKNESDEGIEIYTYALLDYSTGIFSIVNQQGAPNYKVINNFLDVYNDKYIMNLLPIVNANGIDRIYNKKGVQVSSVMMEIPVPDVAVLNGLCHWSEKDILETIGNDLKAYVRISSYGKRVLTDNEEDSRRFIDIVKDTANLFVKPKIRAKADGIKTQDYSFKEENFAYIIDIPSYYISNGYKIVYTLDELVDIYREHLMLAFNTNKVTLKGIANRRGKYIE